MLIGAVAGYTALTLGARGGVFIGGGIMPQMLDAFARSEFRARFEAKRRYRDCIGRHSDARDCGAVAVISRATDAAGLIPA